MWRSAVLALALAGSGAVAGPVVQSWLTTADQTRLLAPQPVLAFARHRPLALTIDVDGSRRYQSMIGFGAAITDASAWLIRHKLDDGQRQALLRELFGRADGGLGFGLARLTLGASDFSLKHYSYDDRPPGETDAALAHFSIDESRGHVLPVVQQALGINPALYLIASPWSAPGWMKTGGSLIKGSLRPDMHGVFARYLLRSVDAFAAEGVPIAALTLQNEPHFEPEDYPGMRLEPADRAQLIATHLGPLLASRGGRPQLIEWDHNWDVPESPLAVLADPAARRFIAGVGWHCYGGEVQAQTRVRDAHPDKDVWLTECSGGAWASDWAKSLPWMVNQLVIGSTRHWARGVLLWNLALDEQQGPHLGGCKDCRGVVTIDSKTGAVTRNLEYYALAHASRFVRAGARRIGSSEAIDGLHNVAFRHDDDGSVVLIVCNDAAVAKTFSVRQNGQVLAYTLPRESVATLVWRP
nr:glycoside hydrolase family 30 beta sandwich domain-containing protein [uncultured Roseateles sp.]